MSTHNIDYITFESDWLFNAYVVITTTKSVVNIQTDSYDNNSSLLSPIHQ